MSKNNEALAVEETTSLLFGRTMTVIVWLSAITGLVSYLTLGYKPTSYFELGLEVATLFGFLFWALAEIKAGEATALIPASFFAAVEGVLLGPVIQHYIKTLGPGTVTQCMCITVGVTATCGLIGYTFNIKYRALESILMIGLFGLILFGVYSAFVGISAETNLTYSVIGMIIFVGFFIVDFARLKDVSLTGEEGWAMATLLGLNIYLDILNFLLDLLASAKKD